MSDKKTPNKTKKKKPTQIKFHFAYMKISLNINNYYFLPDKASLPFVSGCHDVHSHDHAS